MLGSLLHYAYAFPQMALQGVKYSEDETTLESVKVGGLDNMFFK